MARAPCRHFADLLHKNSPGFAQLIDHVLIVNDFLAHVDGRPVKVQSDLDYVDGPHHAGAESPRLQEIDLLFGAVRLAAMGFRGMRRL
jgi:hypothetical protein